MSFGLGYLVLKGTEIAARTSHPDDQGFIRWSGRAMAAMIDPIGTATILAARTTTTVVRGVVNEFKK